MRHQVRSPRRARRCQNPLVALAAPSKPLSTRGGEARRAPRSDNPASKACPAASRSSTPSYIPNIRRLEAQDAIAAASPLILPEKHACSHPALMYNTIEAPLRIPQRLAAINADRRRRSSPKVYNGRGPSALQCSPKAQAIRHRKGHTSSPQTQHHHAPHDTHPPCPRRRRPRSLPALVLRRQQLLGAPHRCPPPARDRVR